MDQAPLTGYEMSQELRLRQEIFKQFKDDIELRKWSIETSFKSATFVDWEDIYRFLLAGFNSHSEKEED